MGDYMWVELQKHYIKGGIGTVDTLRLIKTTTHPYTTQYVSMGENLLLQQS